MFRSVLVELPDKHVRGLQVPVDDGFLMSMLHSLTDLSEKR